MVRLLKMWTAWFNWQSAWLLSPGKQEVETYWWVKYNEIKTECNHLNTK